MMEFLHLVLHFDHYLGEVIATHGTLIYLLLFAIVFCETGIAPLFFLPGNPLIFISGAFCATGHMNLGLLMATLVAAVLAGSTLAYLIGGVIGHKVFTGNYRWLDQDAFRKTHAFYEEHGGMAFLVSPFIPVVRTFAPLVAGVAAMTFTRFVAYVAAGAMVWVALLASGGYFFGNIPVVHDHLNGIVLLGVGGGVGALVVTGLWRAYRRRHRGGPGHRQQRR